nr:MAG TPA: hypothetical protein [Caudoviricetes sp.]
MIHTTHILPSTIDIKLFLQKRLCNGCATVPKNSFY